MEYQCVLPSIIYHVCLQPSYIIQTANRAGVAAEATTLEKDARHNNNVIPAGGIHYPLAVETLGFWSLLIEQTLKTIASIASAMNGFTFAQSLETLMEEIICEVMATQYKNDS